MSLRDEYPFSLTLPDSTGWDWSNNVYRAWCSRNCTGKFNIVKFNVETVHAYFEIEQDALMFLLTHGQASFARELDY